MIVQLILAPRIEGAPVGEPFASVPLEERPLPGEALIFNGDAYRVIGRMIEVEPPREPGAGLTRITYQLLLAPVGRAAPKPSILLDPK